MTESTWIAPIDKTRLADDLALVSSLKEGLQGQPCETEEQEAYWVRMLDSVHAMITELEAERETLVRPLIRDKKLVDDEFKKVTGPAAELKTLIKRKIASRQEALLSRQNEAREAARLAAQAGDTASCVVALAAIPEAAAVVGAKTQWVWEFTVDDARLLPREFLTVNERALQIYADVAKDSESIAPLPGVSFKRAARIAVKGRK